MELLHAWPGIGHLHKAVALPQGQELSRNSQDRLPCTQDSRMNATHIHIFGERALFFTPYSHMFRITLKITVCAVPVTYIFPCSGEVVVSLHSPLMVVAA